MKTDGGTVVALLSHTESRVPANIFSHCVDPRPAESHRESSKERGELRTLIRVYLCVVLHLRTFVPHQPAPTAPALSLSSMVKNYIRKGGHGGERRGAGKSGNKPGHWDAQGGRAAAAAAKARRDAEAKAKAEAEEKRRRKEQWQQWQQWQQWAAPSTARARAAVSRRRRRSWQQLQQLKAVAAVNSRPMTSACDALMCAYLQRCKCG